MLTQPNIRISFEKLRLYAAHCAEYAKEKKEEEMNMTISAKYHAALLAIMGDDSLKKSLSMVVRD